MNEIPRYRREDISLWQRWQPTLLTLGVLYLCFIGTVIAGVLLGFAIPILINISTIDNAVNTLKHGTVVMNNGIDLARGAMQGVSHLDVTQVVRNAVPETNEEAAEQLAGFGRGLRSASDVATEVKDVNVVGMVSSALDLGLKISQFKETGIFFNALTNLGEFVAARAETGGVDEAFKITKEVVLMAVSTLKDKSVQKSLRRVQETVDNVQENPAYAQGLQQALAVIADVHQSGMINSTSEGISSLKSLTSIAQRWEDDFVYGGITIQMPAMNRHARLQANDEKK